jgi:histidinol-phosphate/aromatic aminotransferase/cobyric acid decarboxylase-like protein
MSRNLNNFVSIVAIRAVMAALSDAATVLPERKAAMSRTRRELCAWLDEHELAYIPPQANFIMIDVGRDVRQFASAMPPRGVAVGRPFPPLTNMLRVTIGTDSDMAKFKEVFWSVYRS